jgi:hypothetical protein
VSVSGGLGGQNYGMPLRDAVAAAVFYLALIFCARNLWREREIFGQGALAEDGVEIPWPKAAEMV